MKKIIPTLLITCLISINSYAEKAEDVKSPPSPLRISSMYINKMSTSNEVFDVIIKEYINSFNERQNELITSINQFNDSQNKKLELMTKKINATKNPIDRSSELSSAAYEFNRISKLKLDNEIKQINSSFNNETNVFLKIFKDTMSQYKVTPEEKEFLAVNIKKVSELLKNTKLPNTDSYVSTKLDEYSKADIGLILNNISDFDREYENIISKYNKDLDSPLSNILWENMRSKVKIP